MSTYADDGSNAAVAFSDQEELVGGHGSAKRTPAYHESFNGTESEKEQSSVATSHFVCTTESKFANNITRDARVQQLSGTSTALHFEGHSAPSSFSTCPAYEVEQSENLHAHGVQAFALPAISFCFSQGPQVSEAPTLHAGRTFGRDSHDSESTVAVKGVHDAVTCAEGAELQLIHAEQHGRGTEAHASESSPDVVEVQQSQVSTNGQFSPPVAPALGNAQTLAGMLPQNFYDRQILWRRQRDSHVEELRRVQWEGLSGASRSVPTRHPALRRRCFSAPLVRSARPSSSASNLTNASNTLIHQLKSARPRTPQSPSSCQRQNSVSPCRGRPSSPGESAAACSSKPGTPRMAALRPSMMSRTRSAGRPAVSSITVQPGMPNLMLLERLRAARMETLRNQSNIFATTARLQAQTVPQRGRSHSAPSTPRGRKAVARSAVSPRVVATPAVTSAHVSTDHRRAMEVPTAPPVSNTVFCNARGDAQATAAWPERQSYPRGLRVNPFNLEQSVPRESVAGGQSNVSEQWDCAFQRREEVDELLHVLTGGF